ncbi:MAG: type II toxin-antitoxin system VapC family toxin [Propylenella sp.]
MKGYLLDTDVISVFAPGRSDTPPVGGEVDKWFERNERHLFFSVVTIIELEVGVLTLARKSPGRRQRRLAEWFDEFVERYEEKVLDVDLDIARIASQISDRAKSIGSYPGLPDVVIAATAIAGELTLLSRNIRHFKALGIESVDPFERVPP